MNDQFVGHARLSFQRISIAAQANLSGFAGLAGTAHRHILANDHIALMHAGHFAARLYNFGRYFMSHGRPLVQILQKMKICAANAACVDANAHHASCDRNLRALP